ncbi:glycerol kinase GlpK [Maritalea mediterranea]|uniref:Glycerol kinase n=1 Tax=Maritalea mediterranea TaxID=2909667 RepID=A0ABS9E6H3_9HYPH|nr:glycerol kinase GlpK [Maritalea mediterranea]MCF4098470.1 glycerol kinase GlpK [Maritalea mediterranea]
MAKSYILAIDQGTTSSRAIIFDRDLTPVATGQEEFEQIFPQSGWVEHNPEDIWSTSVAMCHQAIEKAHISPRDIAAIGVTNQRETTILWDRKTGRPIHNAIVWQDRRTAPLCQKLKDDGHEPMVRDKTGLLLDPYFSATKINWILNEAPGALEKAVRGDILFGTVDSYLIWHLTGGQVHATDATNAARTMLYNIVTGEWDQDLCDLFDVPMALLPEVKDSADDFGVTRTDLFGGEAIPIRGVAGDQQAATVGQACFEPGMAKSTYGTGCFVLLNTGKTPVFSNNRLLTTIAYQLNGQPTYALEGAIFVAGAVVQWLRDGLKIIRDAAESDKLAKAADGTQSVYFVPAFTGLGAPYWDAESRGAIFGLTRNSGPAEIACAALESVAFQTRDLIEAMHEDWGDEGTRILRIDGGMANNEFAMQKLADQLQAPVDRPHITETTALGAAYLAGLSAGLFGGPEQFARQWQSAHQFAPKIKKSAADQDYAGWQLAVQRVLYKGD